MKLPMSLALAVLSTTAIANPDGYVGHIEENPPPASSNSNARPQGVQRDVYVDLPYAVHFATEWIPDGVSDVSWSTTYHVFRIRPG